MEDNRNLPALKPKINDEDEELVIEQITCGASYRNIAQHFNVSLWQVFRFVSDPKRSARVREAQQFAAHDLIDRAEAVLIMAKDDKALLQVARDLAHHYRWKAACLHPYQYASAHLTIPVKEEKTETIIRVVRDAE